MGQTSMRKWEQRVRALVAPMPAEVRAFHLCQPIRESALMLRWRFRWERRLERATRECASIFKERYSEMR